MELKDWLEIVAILLSPFIAVFVQRKIDEMKEHSGRRRWVFHMLMATRGNKLSPQHVEALNSIDLVFTDHSDTAILQKWKEYFDHLNQTTRTDDPDVAAKTAVWRDRADELLTNLLEVMGRALGYKFDKVTIKRGVYTPQGHGEEQLDQYIIRKSMVDIMTGKKGFPVKEVNQ
jgi:hypothetical protein